MPGILPKCIKFSVELVELAGKLVHYWKSNQSHMKSKDFWRNKGTSPNEAVFSEPHLKIWDKNLGQNLGQPDGQTDGQTDR